MFGFVDLMVYTVCCSARPELILFFLKNAFERILFLNESVEKPVAALAMGLRGSSPPPQILFKPPQIFV